MGWLTSILRMLAPIAVEHGGPGRRDKLRARAAQAQAAGPTGPDPLELLATDIDQLKIYSLQLKSDLETLNSAIAERDARMRKWLLGLLIWNAAMTVGVVLLAFLAWRH